MNPTICICDEHESFSQKAAGSIFAALRTKPGTLMCAAGGSTPLATYKLLSQRYSVSPGEFAKMRLVKLDEWGGIPMDSPASCETQMRDYLINPLGLSENRYFGFNSSPADPEAECARMRQVMAVEGPIDICVLGLGMNGHVGMNEPADELQPFAHVARLAEASLRHPMLAGSKTVPTYGLTLGIADMIAAGEVLLLVSGAAKHEPLRKLLRARVSPEFPASFLWLHSRWTLLCDREAAAGLEIKS